MMKEKFKKILLKKNKSKIVCLTAYSKSVAKILDKFVDIILVGDSMANVLYGHKNTHKITLTKPKRTCRRAPLVFYASVPESRGQAATPNSNRRNCLVGLLSLVADV